MLLHYSAALCYLHLFNYTSLYDITLLLNMFFLELSLYMFLHRYIHAYIHIYIYINSVSFLGSNPSECQIFHLFCCVLSSLLPLRSVGMSNFDKGLHNLIMMTKKRHKIMIEMKLL